MQIIKRAKHEDQVNLLALIQLMIQKWWVLMFFGMLCGTAVLAVTYFLVPYKYTASATIYVNNIDSSANVSNISSGDISASIMLLQTYETIIKSNTMLEEIREEAEIDMSLLDLSEMIQTESMDGTEILKISVTDKDPKQATVIANAIAEVVPERLTDIVEGSSVKIIDNPVIPSTPSAPSYTKRAVLGFMIGLILSACYIFLMVLTDTRIKSENDLSDWNYPVLGVIPDMANVNNLKGYYKR